MKGMNLLKWWYNHNLITYRAEFLISDWAMIVHVNGSKPKSSYNFGFSYEELSLLPGVHLAGSQVGTRSGSGPGVQVMAQHFPKRTYTLGAPSLMGFFYMFNFRHNFWFNVPIQKVDCHLLWPVAPQKVKCFGRRNGTFFLHLLYSFTRWWIPSDFFLVIPKLWGKFSYWMSNIFQVFGSARLLCHAIAWWMQNDCCINCRPKKDCENQDFVKGEKGRETFIVF